ncbi:hypothetical protein BZG29_14690 [Janthinobacterium sp. LM6]|nr:hypothetical protein BZG29_14690 [Janthinobacterium sp. LM6]
MLLMSLLFIPVQAAPDTSAYQNYRDTTYDIQRAYLQRIAQHQAKMMNDMEQKLTQQQWQTNAISIMVFIMVGFGLVLSALQFYVDFRRGGSSSISIKFGGGSFDLRSTVIGIGILALSFWFFQTYVEKVYEVKVMTVSPIDVTTFGVNR